MKVVILCGGYGTRIRDVADNIPKPMIPIGRYPILWHIMKHYAHFGYREFVLCLGYKGQAIRDFFINYEAHTKDFTIELGRRSRLNYHTEHAESGWRVTLVDTGLAANTGARVRRVAGYIGEDDTFMLTYGDGVGDVDLARLIEFHKHHGGVLTITGVRPPGRFGEIVSGPAGRITEFNEKPQATAGRISGGFFVCNRRIFEYLDDREDLVFEDQPIRRLVADGQAFVYPHDGFWQPMDTYREYALLNQMYERGSAPWVHGW